MMIYTLRVTLIEGPWDFEDCVRILEVQDECTLWNLHDAIQTAVGFGRDHLYDFYAGRGPRNRTICYGKDYEEYEDREDEFATTSLNKVWPLERMKLYYLFDFGDEWLFEIRKERKVKSPEPGVRYPRLIQSIGPNPEQYPDFE
jgi:hypothetical protein